LTNASLPYLLQIANKGWEKAMQENPEIKFGANVIRNRITYKAVAEAFNLDYTPVDEMLYEMWRYN
jgi:alanine dehydrogenase